jgi:hypothetical protein
MYYEDVPGAELDQQQADEIAAENAWKAATEWDPRMDDPREW